MTQKIDKTVYGKELRRMRRLGIPKDLAKKAATCEATVPKPLLPELTNPLGLVWIREHGGKTG